MVPITIFWIVIMVVFIVVELNTINLTTIWFALGAVAAALVSLHLPNEYLVQIAAFVIVTGISVILTRPFARKITGKSIRTNANRVIGEEAVVVEKIGGASNIGQVKILGQVWTAKAKDSDSIFEVGETVIVDEIQGVKLIVSKLEKQSN